MDKTEKYIKMCEKAEKIQQEWKPAFGDYVLCKSSPYKENSIGLVQSWGLMNDRVWIFYRAFSLLDETTGEHTYGELHAPISEFIWLPRQDQLQEMINSTPKADALVPNNSCYKWRYAESWKQLWFAFVMHEKYGKVWDDIGGEWVKEGINEELIS